MSLVKVCCGRQLFLGICLGPHRRNIYRSVNGMMCGDLLLFQKYNVIFFLVKLEQFFAIPWDPDFVCQASCDNVNFIIEKRNLSTAMYANLLMSADFIVLVFLKLVEWKCLHLCKTIYWSVGKQWHWAFFVFHFVYNLYGLMLPLIGIWEHRFTYNVVHIIWRLKFWWFQHYSYICTFLTECLYDGVLLGLIHTSMRTISMNMFLHSIL